MAAAPGGVIAPGAPGVPGMSWMREVQRASPTPCPTHPQAMSTNAVTTSSTVLRKGQSGESSAIGPHLTVGFMTATQTPFMWCQLTFLGVTGLWGFAMNGY